MYEETEIYPMHGESCYSYFRECEYLNICTLSTANITTPPSPTDVENINKQLSEFQIHVTLDDLIQAQLSKDTAPSPHPQNQDELLWNSPNQPPNQLNLHSYSVLLSVAKLNLSAN